MFDPGTSNNNTALFAKQFKGFCRECGGYGHKKANCPKLKNKKKNIIMSRTSLASIVAKRSH